MVGCPRSGTSFAQTVMACHRDIYTLPETNYFRNVVPERRPYDTVFMALGLAHPSAPQKRLKKLLELNGFEEEAERLPRKSFRIAPYARRFQSVMDRAAARESASAWLEKSPRHVFRIGIIRRFVRDPVFIHIVRSGKDTVASMVDAARRHGGYWESLGDPLVATAMWNRAMHASERAARRGGEHIFVRYESMRADRARVAEAICRRVGLDPDRLELADADKAASKVVESHEVWKSGLFGGKAQGESKFDSTFTEQEREAVVAHLAPVPDLPWLEC